MKFSIAPVSTTFVDTLPSSVSTTYAAVKSSGKVYQQVSGTWTEVAPLGKGAPKYNGSFMSPAYLEFSEICSPTPIDWEVGCMVYYPRTSQVYKLYNIPQPTRKAGNNNAGNAFVYKNVQFYAATKDLELAPFRDVVLEDNDIHYSTMPTISTFEDVQGIADRIQANMDLYAGSDVWSIEVVEASSGSELATLLATAKDFSVSNVSCLEVLNQIYDTWGGVGWIFSVVDGVNTITIGGPNVRTSDNTSNQFVYGKGNGLTVITKAESQQNDLITRLYAYGNTNNLISRYYNNVLYGNVQVHILDYESVNIPNLMLPLADWGVTTDSGGHIRRDARKAYLEDTTAASNYGVRAKTLYFDGTDGLDDIYPTIEGVTAKNLRDAIPSGTKYRPSSSYTDDERMDEIKSAINPTDDGVASYDGSKYSEIISVDMAAISSQTFSVPAMKAKQSTRVTVFSSSETSSGFSTTVNRARLVSGLNLEAQLSIGSLTRPLYVKDNIAHVEIYAGGKQVESVDVKGSMNLSLERFQVQLSEVDFYVAQSGQKMTFRVTLDLVAAIDIDDDSNSCFITAPASKHQFCRKEASSVPADFSVTLKQVGFNINDRQSMLSEGLCTLNMKSGRNGGRAFTIKKCVYDSTNDAWTLTCGRTLDESLNEYFPNVNSTIAAGDLFVLTDLEMPEIYVTSAMSRLHDVASAWLTSHCNPRVTYTPEIDSKFMQDQLEAGTLIPLSEGMYFNILDTDITSGAAEYILIDSLTIDEGNALPKYSVTLRDDKYSGSISILKKEKKAQETKSRIESLKKYKQYNLPTEQENTVEATISSDKDSFNSLDESEDNTIIAQCSSGVAAATYQWQYWNETTSAYVNISGATKEFYTVTPDDSAFQGSTARIRCQVTYSDNDGATQTINTEDKNITKPSSGAGTSDYSALSNKPSINSITLLGNKTSQDLGLTPLVSDSIVNAFLSDEDDTLLTGGTEITTSELFLTWVECEGLITDPDDPGIDTVHWYFDHIGLNTNQMSNLNGYNHTLTLHSSLTYGQFYINATTLYNSLNASGWYIFDDVTYIYVYDSSTMTSDHIVGLVYCANHPLTTVYNGWTENGVTKNYGDVIRYISGQRCQFVPYNGVSKIRTVIGKTAAAGTSDYILCFGTSGPVSVMVGEGAPYSGIFFQQNESSGSSTELSSYSIAHGPDYAYSAVKDNA